VSFGVHKHSDHSIKAQILVGSTGGEGVLQYWGLGEAWYLDFASCLGDPVGSWGHVSLFALNAVHELMFSGL
jgi:hypothetical protein